MTTASQPRAARGRRAARPSGDDRELAILDTAERLLEERPLAEISVDDLAKGAGISRPTFYFYFPSKDAVLLTLLERVIVEADAALESASDRWTPADRYDCWRAGINVFFETFAAHQAVYPRRREVTATNSEVRELLVDDSCRSGSTTPPATIEAERGRGDAPDDPARSRSGHRAEPDERAGAVRVVRRRTPAMPAERLARHPGAHLGHQHLRRNPVTRRPGLVRTSAASPVVNFY